MLARLRNSSKRQYLLKASTFPKGVLTPFLYSCILVATCLCESLRKPQSDHSCLARDYYGRQKRPFFLRTKQLKRVIVEKSEILSKRGFIDSESDEQWCHPITYHAGVCARRSFDKGERSECTQRASSRRVFSIPIQMGSFRTRSEYDAQKQNSKQNTLWLLIFLTGILRAYGGCLGSRKR